jgi:hypothetical protein
VSRQGVRTGAHVLHHATRETLIADANGAEPPSLRQDADGEYAGFLAQTRDALAAATQLGVDVVCGCSHLRGPSPSAPAKPIGRSAHPQVSRIVASQVNKVGGKSLRPEHIQAARALVGWSQFELADSAKIGRATVQRLECGLNTEPASVRAMKAALERAGVRFIVESKTGGAGVRLRKRQRQGAGR